MPDSQIIIKIEGVDSASPAFNAVAQAAKKVDGAIKETGNTMKQAGEIIEQGARKGETAMKQVAEATDNVSRRDMRRLATEGAMAFQVITNGAAQSSASMRMLSSGVGEVAGAFAMGTGIGAAFAAVTAGVKLAVTAYQEYINKAADVIVKNDQVVASYAKMAEGNVKMTAQVHELAAAMAEQGNWFDKIKELYSKSADVSNSLAGNMKALGFEVESASQVIERNRAALELHRMSLGEDRAEAMQAAAASRDFATAQTLAAQAAALAAEKQLKEAAALRELNAALVLNAAVRGKKGDESYIDYDRLLADDAKYWTDVKKLAEDAARKTIEAFRGAVEKALQPSAITAKDQQRNDLLVRQAKLQEQINGLGEGHPQVLKRLQSENDEINKQIGLLGPYKTKWDEFARRAEAVAAGTNKMQFGPAFAKQLDSIGMSAEAAAAGFRDFSLFADPKNLGLIDWGPLVADIDHQIDMIIGRANAMREGFDKAWAAMSPQKKLALADALNLPPSAVTNTKEMFGALTDATAKDADKNMQSIATQVKTLEGTHTTTLELVWTKAKTAIDDFEDYLTKHVLKYGKITIDFEGTSGTITAAASSTAGHLLAAGGSFIVPPGYPGDSYPIRVSSGERVVVEPTATSSNFISQAAAAAAGPHSTLFGNIAEALGALPGDFGSAYAGRELDLPHFGRVTVPVSFFSLDEATLARELASALGGSVSQMEIDELAKRITAVLSNAQNFDQTMGRYRSNQRHGV